MSILNVNQIQPVGSGQTVTISAANITASSSTITANTFSGSLSSSGVSTFSDTVNVGAGKSIRLYGASSGYSDIVLLLVRHQRHLHFRQMEAVTGNTCRPTAVVR
jgi:hypothetical protein